MRVWDRRRKKAVGQNKHALPKEHHTWIWWWMLKYCVKLNKYHFFSVHWKLPFPVSMHNFFVCFFVWKETTYRCIYLMWFLFSLFCSLHLFNSNFVINHIFHIGFYAHDINVQMLIYLFKFPIYYELSFSMLSYDSLAFYYSRFINIFSVLFVNPLKCFSSEKHKTNAEWKILFSKTWR